MTELVQSVLWRRLDQPGAETCELRRTSRGWELRGVVVLAYYQGLKYREVADILDVPVGTVKSRLHTALLKLQEMWSELPAATDI